MDGFVDNRARIGSGEQVGITGRWECRWCRFPVNARRRQNVCPANAADGNVVATADGVVTSVEAKQGCPMCGHYGWAAVRNPPKNETKLLNRRRVRPFSMRSRRRIERF